MEAGSAECKRRMRATRENFGETRAAGEGVPSEFLGHPECAVQVVTSVSGCGRAWCWGAGESGEGGSRVSTLCTVLFLDRCGAEPHLQILAKRT